MNANDELIAAMRRQFGTPTNFLKSLGLDESLLPGLRANISESRDDNDDPDDQDDLGKRLAFVQSKLSNADFLGFVKRLIVEARSGAREPDASDRRTAKDDLQRTGNLETSSLRSGITPSAPSAHDAAPTDASRKSFEQMFGTAHMPGVA